MPNLPMVIYCLSYLIALICKTNSVYYNTSVKPLFKKSPPEGRFRGAVVRQDAEPPNDSRLPELL